MLVLAASLFTERVYQWGGIALLAFACAPWRTWPANLLGTVTVGYCAWQFASALVVSPVYAAEGLYRPLLLLGGFAAIASLGRDRWRELFGAGTALLSALVLLGLAQHFLGLWNVELSVWRLQENPVRAAATFVTPNSFATAINMFLVPLAALYLLEGSRRSYVLALWLFAGLVATQSRGGMLACLAGMAFIAACLGLPGLRASRDRALALLAGIAVVWLVVAGAGMAGGWWSGIGGTAESLATAPWLGRGTAERPELYAATFQLIREHPLAGWGASMFFPLFEMLKPASLSGYEYSYSHNDYLQAWLEFGAPGLVLLLLLVGSALLSSLREHRRAPGDGVPLVCGAALATCFAHAVVDFPLYVPFTLMLTGAFLGALAAHAGGSLPATAARVAERAQRIVTPPIRRALAVAALAWLAQPMIAEFAVQRSIVLLARGEARDALHWQSIARRLEPRHAAHYWAEATIWRDQAVFNKNPTLAAKADELFAAGTRVNRYDVANLLGRIELRRRHPELLPEVAPRAELLAWAERAAALRPTNLTVQAELVRTFAHVGERERAQRLARALLAQYPASNLARRLAAEF